MAITLDGLDVTSKLPTDWADTTLRKAFQNSVVGQLSAAEPIPTNGKIIPIYEGGFEVGYTKELGRKPVSDVKATAKAITPCKFAGIIVVSKEAARANPGRLLEIMQADMRNAVQRQLDLAILFGISANGGAAIPDATFINQTTNTVELDASKDLVPQFLAGYDLVASGDGEYDPNGYAFDSRMRTRVALASQQMLTVPGASTPMPNLAVTTGTLGGLPVAYGRTVGRRFSGDPKGNGVVGVVGDWSKLRWGYSSNLELTRSDQASIVDAKGQTINTFQDNAIAYRVEFEAGWYVDPSAFATFTNTTDSPSSEPAEDEGDQ